MSKYKLYLIAATIVVAFLFSCTSSRHVVKTETIVDSSATEAYKDSFRVAKEEAIHWRSKYNEQEYNEVEFDSSKCPPPFITIDEHCNADSVRAVLEGIYTNKVKVLANGTKEYSGNIARFKFKLEKSEERELVYKQTIDSLRMALSEKKIEYKTVTVEKEVKSKTKVLNFWWLLIVGLVAGLFIERKFKLIGRFG